MEDSPAFEEVVAGLMAGEPNATAEVFERFRNRLVALARQLIVDPRLRAKFDPEDLVQSAFLTFWRHCKEGEFELEDWDSLWNLLAKITERRCYKYWKHYSQTSKQALYRESGNVADGRTTHFACGVGWGRSRRADHRTDLSRACGAA